MVPYSGNLLQEEIFAYRTIFSQKKCLQLFDYWVHNPQQEIHGRLWIQKCVLALIIANAFEIQNFAKLKDW